jgi:hypothetical protein
MEMSGQFHAPTALTPARSVKDWNGVFIVVKTLNPM